MGTEDLRSERAAQPDQPHGLGLELVERPCLIEQNGRGIAGSLTSASFTCTHTCAYTHVLMHAYSVHIKMAKKKKRTEGLIIQISHKIMYKSGSCTCTFYFCFQSSLKAFTSKIFLSLAIGSQNHLVPFSMLCSMFAPRGALTKLQSSESTSEYPPESSLMSLSKDLSSGHA